MPVNALTVRNLEKTYPRGTRALCGVSLQVKEGSFFGLLGPNGAGKTTLIGIVAGLVNRTSGEVDVFGVDSASRPNEAKRLIGLVPQEFNFNIFESVIISSSSRRVTTGSRAGRPFHEPNSTCSVLACGKSEMPLPAHSRAA